MQDEILKEYSDLVSMFVDDDWDETDMVETLQAHTTKNMVPSKLVSPNDKFAKRSDDKDAKKHTSALVKNEPLFTNTGDYLCKEYAENLHYFDITDKETRRVIFAVNEDDQNRLLTALTSKLYDNIIDKVDDIDFGDIPETKGDITKLPNFEKITNCIDLIDQIVKKYRQDPVCIKTIKEALNNLISRKETFMKAYRYNSELLQILYSSIALGIVSGLSLLIATCIEFIKAPGKTEYQVTFDTVAYNRSKDHLIFDNLDKFNVACKSGKIDTVADVMLRNHMKNFTGVEMGMWAAGVAAIGLILNIIPILRELIFFYYYSRTRVADYFEMQANLLQMNAHNLEMSKNIQSAEERDRIIRRQNKLVEVFRRIANFFQVTAKNAEVKATKEIVNDDKKFKTSELMDEVPDSANASLF
jgi:hypothetical protein